MIRRVVQNKYLIVLYIFILSSLIYTNSLKNGFTSEDYFLIINNKFIQNFNNSKIFFTKDFFLHPTPIVAGARPLTLLSLMLDFKIWKFNPFGYHLTNLILHSLNSVLVFFLFTALNINPTLALFSTLLFSFHPAHTEPVNVPGFRSILLATFFLIIALIFSIKLIKSKNLFYTFPISISFILAILTKEISIIFPLIFLLFLINLKPENKKLILLTILIFTILGVIYIEKFLMPRFRYDIFSVIFVNLTGKTKPFSSFVAYFDTISKTFLHYIKTLIFPLNLSYDYQLNLTNKITMKLILGIVFIIATIICAFKTKIYEIRIGLGIFLLSYLPVSNLIPLHNIYADRYLYIPLIGFSLILGKILFSLKKYMTKSMLKYLPLIIFLTTYSFATFSRNYVYKNMLTLYKNTVKKSPLNPRVKFHLALAYMENKMWNSAIKELEDISKINPIYKRINIWQLLGENYQMIGKNQMAKKYYIKVLITKPKKETFYNMAVLLKKEGNIKGAKWLLKKLKEKNS